MKPSIFKFDNKTTKLLCDLKLATKASSKSDVIRRALYLLKIVCDASENNRVIVMQNPDGTEHRKINLK